MGSTDWLGRGRAAAAASERSRRLEATLSYAQLEQGARHLAAGAAGRDERFTHLGMANRYARLATDETTRGIC